MEAQAPEKGDVLELPEAQDFNNLGTNECIARLPSNYIKGRNFSSKGFLVDR